MKKTILFWGVLFLSMQLVAQQVPNKPQKPYSVGKPDRIIKVPSIASRLGKLKKADLSAVKEMKDGRASKYDIVIGKGSTGDDILAKKPNRLKNKTPGRTPSLVFDTGASSSQPTDPAGAVGPNHYISVINTGFQIFDKDGNSLTGGVLAPNPTIFTSSGCCDLTALYDDAADRWVLSFLNGGGAGAQVAVSNGPDPMNDGWTVYNYPSVNDYQKLSVWRDGYYMTDNNSTNKLHVFERSAMIDAASAGTTPQIVSFTLPGIVTSGFNSPQVLSISAGDWPTSGPATIVYLQDDAWSGVTEDHIKLWSVTMDWSNTSNSQVSAAVELGNAEGVSPFVAVFDGGGFSNLAQPNGGSSIDALQATIMNQAQYRKFSGYNSALFNFVVDVDGSATKQAGIRWYELRQTTDGQPWTVHQEGTYTSPDNKHAWNASLIMDVQGNIGMGYTAMSSANSSNSTVYAGSYYTGRLANDPTGTMTVAETVIKAGTGNMPSNRYGDYSKIDIDPDGDKKFWFVNELVDGSRKNVAGVFQIAPLTNNDVGVISIDTPTSGVLGNNETITVTVQNFGNNAASGFDVTYQVDGGTLVTQAYTGTLASGATTQVTFTTTADLSTEGQTYSITSSTNLSGDEDTNNDSVTQNVTHVFANDLGITAITAPVSGENLGMESVVVTIENFGTASQSNFNVTYTINGGTTITETVSGPLAAGATMSYTFTSQGDFSDYGDFTIVASTALSGDTVISNNSSEVTISNISCNTTENTTQASIGPNSGTVTESIINMPDTFTISDVNVTINLTHTWVGDIDIKIIGPDGTEVVLSDRKGSSGDNYTNTTFDSDASQAISSGTPPYTGTFSPDGDLADFNGKQSNGDWKLVITDNASGDGGNLLNWSLQLCTNANLSTERFELNGDFVISSDDNDFFNIQLNNTSVKDRLDLRVYNMLGQQLLWKTLENNGNGYEYNLNMSYAATGVYIVKLSNGSKVNSAKIIVK